MEMEPASETFCLFKKSNNGQSPEKENVSVNFSGALLSLLYFLILADGTDRLP
jgi:hypothetical protein